MHTHDSTAVQHPIYGEFYECSCGWVSNPFVERERKCAWLLFQEVDERETYAMLGPYDMALAESLADLINTSRPNWLRDNWVQVVTSDGAPTTLTDIEKLVSG